jgi:hypothetical protein
MFSEISNSFARASQQLNGTLMSQGQLVADEAKKGENPDGSFDVDVINFLEAFDVDGFPFVTNFEDDANFPGIPGTGDHYSLFTTQLELIPLMPKFSWTGLMRHRVMIMDLLF